MEPVDGVLKVKLPRWVWKVIEISQQAPEVQAQTVPEECIINGFLQAFKTSEKAQKVFTSICYDLSMEYRLEHIEEALNKLGELD